MIIVLFQQVKGKMLQKEGEGDYQLDELIEIVNPRARELRPLPTNKAEAAYPPEKEQYQREFVGAAREAAAMMKALRFKPWSGREIVIGEQGQVIHEEIQGIEQRQEEEEEDLDVEKGGLQNFSQMSNMAKHDEIGYFYKFQNGAVKLIKKLLDENGFKWANTNKNWTLYWSSTIIKMEIYHALLPYQKVNHFPNSFHLTRKDLMNKCISKMQIRHGMSHFNFLPKTFILPQELSLLEEQMARSPGITYIVKPHNRSQGKGITVTTQMNTVLSKLEKYSSLIVSHYVGNPLLINNLKFDLRIYVALLGVNPLRIYIYHEGLGRFATETYDQNASDCQNKRYQHLTNYSVNKKNTEFVKSEKENEEYFGSKWSLSALKDFLSFNIGKQETTELFARIDDLIVKTILSGQNILHSSFLQNVPYNNACYEVLGFDVLIDSNLKPWLMEVNMSPSMNSDSPLDIKIKGNMIADLLTLAAVAPLADRYIDGSHLRYDIKNYRKPDSKQVELGPVQRFVLKQAQTELARCGGWRRLFPCGDKRYKQFFQSDRYFNRLLRQFENHEDKPTSSTAYRSVGNERQRTSIPKPAARIGYLSTNDKKRGESREKAANFSIRMAKPKKVYL